MCKQRARVPLEITLIMNTSNLKGQRVVVTGASSGIGEATARLLARHGSSVCLLARNAVRLSTIVDEIRSEGGLATAYPVDLADPAATATTAAQLCAAWGVPNVLINNAGAGRWLSIRDTSAAEAANMMAVPYLAAFNLTRELLPGMIARGDGQILNITSVAARLAWPGAVAYAAARHAIEGFSNALRADLAGTGLAVTLAIFGTVESDYWHHNPGSRERLPASARQMRVLRSDEAAHHLVSAIGRKRRTIIEPGMFRMLFLLSHVFPEIAEASMR